MRPGFIAYVLSFLLIAIGGCDILGSEDHTIRLTGRVVNQQGQPIAGISVTLIDGAGIYATRASTSTNAAGEFTIAYDPGDIHYPLLLELNESPHNARFTTQNVSVVKGTRRDLGELELQETVRT